MLRSLNELRGYSVHATDGDIGKVHDFYFDDVVWTIRYLVVETGNWLTGRRVLVSPAALRPPDWDARALPVSLTKQQVESSPDVDFDKPISRQKEIELSQYYGWPIYWGDPLLNTGLVDMSPSPLATLPKSEGAGEPRGDPHLESMKDVIGYRIHAVDGDIGHVDDFIAEDQSWFIRYLVIDTKNWLPSKKVLVAPQWVKEVSWADSKIHLDVAREIIRNSPEFDPSAPISREYEAALYDYYQRPRYWR